MTDLSLNTIKKIRGRFWIALIFLALILTLCWCLVTGDFSMPKPEGDPLLGGPGGLTVLAIVVALSAYLRGVASNADERRDDVRQLILDETVNGRKKDIYQRKLNRLNGTCENMHVAAPLMMWLTIFMTARLVLESLIRGGMLQSYRLFARRADFLILTWLLLTFITLFVLHHYAWRHDEEIRGDLLVAKADEKERAAEELQ